MTLLTKIASFRAKNTLAEISPDFARSTGSSVRSEKDAVMYDGRPANPDRAVFVNVQAECRRKPDVLAVTPRKYPAQAVTI